MSDTVKLIIELPEWKYKSICEGVEASKRCGVVGIDPDIHEAIYNGTPLDDLKAEIDKAQKPYMTSADYDEGVRFGLMLAYQILDRIGKESEDI